MGSYNQAADMKTFLVLLLVSCVLVEARSRGRKPGNGRKGSMEKQVKQGRHQDKKRSKNKKPTKAEKKRQQDRSKMRRKLKQKEDTKGRSHGAKHKKNKKHGAAQPRTNNH